MGTRFKKVRFHVEHCPYSLIERIYFKMSSITTVKTNAKHFLERVDTRNIPEFVLEKIKNFNIKEWKLVTCKVRADTGKFVNSTWEIIYNGNRYWLTIGFGNVAETIVRKTSSGIGKIIDNTNEDMYKFVETVNSKLMYEERNCENYGIRG